MARKNLLAGITAGKLTAVNQDDPPPQHERPAAPTFVGRGAFGAVTRTIDDLAAKAEAARDIEARLTAGETVVDLDPTSIDGSFVTDRLSHDDEEFRNLLEAMRTRGQDSPILVRPSPETAGRYQVAFGHRRLRAATVLARPVRAVVKHLTDRDLILAQGQENSARANLSFIERAVFAQRLELAGHDRETIMSALSVDKTVVSRMVSVASRIPLDAIVAIGSAPGTGRDRWVELASAFHALAGSPNLTALVTDSEFQRASSDERFNLMLAHLEHAPPLSPQTDRKEADRPIKTGVRPWSTPDGKRVASVKVGERIFALSIDQRMAPGFGEFLLAQLDRLHAAYEEERKEQEKTEPENRINPTMD